MTPHCMGLPSQIHIVLKFKFIENEQFNCLTRQGYNLKHNFGHGRHGLANLLATLNLFAFTLHAVLDCVSDLWRQCRARLGPRHNCFATLRFLTEWFCFPSWTALFETVLRKPPHDAICPPSCQRQASLPEALSRGASRPVHDRVIAAARRLAAPDTESTAVRAPRNRFQRRTQTLADSTPHEPAPPF